MYMCCVCKILCVFVVFAYQSIYTYAKNSDYWGMEHSISPVKGFVRLYGGINCTVPTSLMSYKKYINCIQTEGVSAKLAEVEKEQYLVFKEISSFNAAQDPSSNSQVNDCLKFYPINNFIAKYKDGNDKEVLCMPFFIINIINSFQIIAKLNSYLSIATKLRNNSLNGNLCDGLLENMMSMIGLPQDSNTGNVFESQRLKRDMEIQQILDQSPYKSLFKKLTILPLHAGLGYTYWFNNYCGLDLDISCSCLYLSYINTFCLPHLNKKIKKLLKFLYTNGLEYGHIVNLQQLKNVIENQQIRNNYENILEDIRKSYGNTKDVVTNVFIRNFCEEMLSSDVAFLNFKVTLVHVSPTIKVGIVINCNKCGNLQKYGSLLLSNLHQFVISPGIRMNITGLKIKVFKSKECLVSDKTKKDESKDKKKERYGNTFGDYKQIIEGKDNIGIKHIGEVVSYLKNDFIPKFKIIPLIEIKYRYHSRKGFFFEIGTTLFLRSFFNITFNRQAMLNYFNKDTTIIPKCDDNMTDEELQEQKNTIKNNIIGFRDSPGADWGFFFSIGWSWAI